MAPPSYTGHLVIHMFTCLCLVSLMGAEYCSQSPLNPEGPGALCSTETGGRCPISTFKAGQFPEQPDLAEGVPAMAGHWELTIKDLFQPKPLYGSRGDQTGRVAAKCKQL